MRLGISSFAFRWFAAENGKTRGSVGLVEELLDRTEALGGNAFQANENVGSGDWTTQTAAELGAAARRRGIELEIGGRSAEAAHVRRLREIAEAAGARRVRLVVDPERPDFGAAELRALLEGLAVDFARSGMNLALENHFHFSPGEIASIMRDIAATGAVSVCLDPLNAIARLVGPDEATRTLLPYASCVHVKDATVARQKTGFYVSGCPVGAGSAEAAGLLRSAAAAPSIDCAFLELWMDALDDTNATLARERAWVAESMDFMRRIIV